MAQIPRPRREGRTGGKGREEKGRREEEGNGVKDKKVGRKVGVKRGEEWRGRDRKGWEARIRKGTRGGKGSER